MRKKWELWEIEVAQRFGGDRVKGSGRFDMFKGDVKTDRLLIDCKCTESARYTLTAEFWDLLSDWARNESREPVVAVKTKDAEIAVVSSPFYWDYAKTMPKFANFVEAKSKRISAKSDDVKPSEFRLGQYTLMAYSLDKFEEDMNENRER